MNHKATLLTLLGGSLCLACPEPLAPPADNPAWLQEFALCMNGPTCPLGDRDYCSQYDIWGSLAHRPFSDGFVDLKDFARIQNEGGGN